MKESLTIIGGGITGLASAYLAARAGWKVRILESSDACGGLLRTFPVADTQLEFFYHHFFTHDAEIHWLLKELDLEEHLRYIDSTMGVYRDGEIFQFNGPRDLLDFAPMGFLDKVRFGLTSLYLAHSGIHKSGENKPALPWFRRWAGKKATASLWEPMIRVKFGPHAEGIPISWMGGRLRQRVRSRKGATEQLGYLDGSLNVLLQGLLKNLEAAGVEIHTNTRVEKLHLNGNHLTGVSTSVGKFEDERFLSTIPANFIKPLLQEASPTLASTLPDIDYFGATCVILELEKPLSDIYWLNVADPGYSFGGVIEHTNLLGPENYGGRSIVYLSRYHAAEEEIAGMPSEAVADLMTNDLRKIFPDLDDRGILKTHIYRTKTAAPVCLCGFSKQVPNCRTQAKSLYLANMSHVYPDERSCNNAIRVAAEACRVMGIPTSDVPKGFSLSGQIGMD